ncbi:MAG: glycoside hydrolase family 57 protein [Pseudomonadota bacterium]
MLKNIPAVCIAFESHRPYLLRPYSFFDIGKEHRYDDDEGNRKIINKIADNCYIPANRVLLELMRQYGGEFRLAFSLSGVFLEQLEMYRPDVIASFQELGLTGCVEFLSESYYHSFAFLSSSRDFSEQVAMQDQKIRELFGQKPVTLKYTELFYSNALALLAEEMGYQTILADGNEKILGLRSPNFVYHPAGLGNLTLLLKNNGLSDDIALRFGDSQWSEYPLKADKFAVWLQQLRESSDVINLFMDYETFGEHQRQETGIFEFMRALPREIMERSGFRFQKPTEATRDHAPAAQLDLSNPLSRAGRERDLSAWLGNVMQQDAIRALYDLEDPVRAKNDAALLNDWRKLQASDHFYYMNTERLVEKDVSKPFTPYESPYDAYINYMNIMDDFSRRLGSGGRMSWKKRKLGAASRP